MLPNVITYGAVAKVCNSARLQPPCLLAGSCQFVNDVFEIDLINNLYQDNVGSFFMLRASLLKKLRVLSLCCLTFEQDVLQKSGFQVVPLYYRNKAKKTMT